jgi:SAM-dependent methyltransferase
VSRHFDHVAAAYDESLPDHVRAHYRALRVGAVRRLAPRGLVLEVGCGTGELAGALAAAGLRVVGLDPSAGMLDVFRRRGGRRLVQGDGAALPVRHDSVDLAVTVATLHHVAAAEAVRATLAEMVRVVRPGGAVLVWDHNPLNPYWPILMRRLPQDQDEHRLVPLAEIVDGLRAAGAGRVEITRRGWVPDFVPPALLGLCQRLERVLERTPGVRALGAHNVVVAVKEAGVRVAG